MNIFQAVDVKVSDFQFIKYKLPFGKHILHRGKFTLDQSLFSSEQNQQKHFLLGVCLQNSLEVFTEHEHQTTPLRIIAPGDIFPISEFKGFLQMDDHAVTNITAGARSIFLAPKLMDINCFRRLAKIYQLKLDMPINLKEQWPLLVQLAAKLNSSWEAQILVMAIKEEVFMGRRCNSLRAYLTELGSNYQSFLHEQLCFERTLMNHLTDPLSKINFYGLTLLKQLNAIGNKRLPGFVFAQDESLAPIKLLQQAFIKDYRIDYAPHMIYPGYIRENGQPCYHSLYTSSLFSNTQQIQVSNLTKMKGVYKLIRLLSSNNSHPASSRGFLGLSLAKWFNDYDHTFLHPAALNGVKGVLPTEQILVLDSSLTKDLKLYGLPFGTSSPFLRGGCIAVQKKDPKQVLH